MITQLSTQSIWFKAAALFAVIFGLLTIISGGQVLLSAEAQQAAGAYVNFVVWFNTLAGFAYVVAGVGMWTRQPWAAKLALVIALATLLVSGVFALHVLSGGAYEMRTVMAMLFRTLVWGGLTVLAQRDLKQLH